MVRTLVVYGTTDGHTRKIAFALAEALRAERCSVHVAEAARGYGALTPAGYDGVIVAASVHGGQYQRAVVRWVRAHAAALNRVPSAFVSVSLGVLDRRPDAQRAVDETMQRLYSQSGWYPTVTKAVAGALLYTRYGWLKRWIMRRIVRKAGGDVDTTRDYEYTDWIALRELARRFAARLARRELVGGTV